MTAAQKAHQFILTSIAEGKTVYLSTAYRKIKLDRKVVERFTKANYSLFKYNSEGDLLLASGKQYNVICCKNVSILQIAAV
jgi:hypothetical protein